MKREQGKKAWGRRIYFCQFVWSRPLMKEQKNPLPSKLFGGRAFLRKAIKLWRGARFIVFVWGGGKRNPSNGEDKKK